MKKNNNISVAKVGMSKDTSAELLQKSNYTFAINMNIENEGGELFKLKSEHSNILASKFKAGFKVIGMETNIALGDTYFLLTNPTTNESEFGVIRNIHNFTLPEDIEVACSDCESKNMLANPLEDIEQVQSQTYETILNDECNKCLNLDIRYPIRKMVIKNEQTGVKIFFSDNLNPPRYIDLSRLDDYLSTGTNVCGVDNTITTCLDCDKLRMFPIYTPIRIEPKALVLGGNTKLGQYSFYAAYSDNLGNELSEYTSLTNPISIFDANNRITNDVEAEDRTSKAIKLKVEDLDLDFKYFKIVVAHQNVIDSAMRYYEVGVFPATVNEIIFSTELDKKEISLNDILLPRPNIKTLEGFTESNNYLLGYGVTVEKEWNLQPVVNLMGGFMRWQTHIASERLYEDGVNVSKYKGYSRDEVYPLALQFVTNEGFRTARFPLVGSPASATDVEEVTGTDIDSIANSKGSCEETPRSKRWEFYNTATEEGRYSVSDVPTSEVVEDITKVCTLEDVSSGSPVPPGAFSIYDLENFTSVIDFINDNPNCGNSYPFCQYTDPTLYDSCLPEFNTSKVNAGNFIVGRDYEINIVGDTDFTVIGAADNNIGTVFTATGEGTGTGKAILQNCGVPALQDEFIEVSSIENLIVDYIPYVFPGEYPTLKGASSCDMWDRDGEGKVYLDHDFMDNYINSPSNVDDDNIRARKDVFGNQSATSADRLQVAYDTSTALGLAYFNVMYGGNSTDPLDIQHTAFQTGNADTFYLPGVHKGGLWFYADLGTTPDCIFEFTKPKKVSSFHGDDHADTFTFRVSIFSSRNGGTALFSKIFNVGDTDAQFKVKFHYVPRVTTPIVATDIIKGETYEINTVGTTDFTLIGSPDNNVGTIFTATNFGTGTGDALLQNLVLEDDQGSPIVTDVTIEDKVYIAVDTEFRQVSDAGAAQAVGTYWTTSPQYCYSVALQELQYSRIDVSYDSLILDKFQRYVSTCSFDMPIVDECSAVPHAYGNFAYWESTESYPDNAELFNSRILEIPETTFDGISAEMKSEFEAKYTSGVDGDGNYVLLSDTDLRCKPIRHFKFPDNKVSPFMYNNPIPGFSESVIFPLGVTIDERVISKFLDLAVVNSLITQEQRDSIIGYELFRGDRTLSKSIVAKGLLYDMYKYTEDGKDIHFANFPYNDLGDNELFYENEDSKIHIQHPFGGDSNFNFMFHSPETEYFRPTLPSEMKVEGYMFGNSKGVFNEVKDHPKYVILGREAKRLASTLATLEVVAEAAIIAAESAEVYRVQFGLANSINIPGIILNVLAVAANVISAATFKYGRYKYEWLQTFRNLGDPENFAQYYSSVGNYNYLQSLQEEGDLVRGINKSNFLKSGRFIITNEVAGEKVEINHIDRERGVFLTLGSAYGLDYPEEYRTFDNGETSGGLNSRFIASQTNQCTKGKSKEFIKNIASPYVALKTYIPAQYGRVDNIDWLSTSYYGDLQAPSSDATNLGIFGGDIFISRHTLKRKVPLFLDSAMGLASLTPFAYQSYSNLGTGVKHYANFYSPKDVTIDRGMPSLETEYSFDCLTGNRDFYVRRPSKFYLYYYGIANFLTETEINTNFRVGRAGYDKQFYPLVEDYEDWTQEKNVSIREDNQYYYSNAYSSKTLPSVGRTLPFTYEAKVFDELYDSPNGVIYSLPDNSEKDLVEPWLTFRPLDKYEFPSSYGKLKELRGVESAQVLGRFEHTTVLFNALDTMVDGISVDSAQLGNGGLFRQRPITFSSTDLGYVGTQSFQMVSCEYGHFTVDAKRGQVFRLGVGGGRPSLTEISSDTNNRGTGMRNWFKQQLPFKILDKSVGNYENIDIDNPYNGIGIAMGWDSRFKRVFLTKRDYKPIKPVTWGCKGFYDSDLTRYQSTIDTYTSGGYTFDGIDECNLKFSKEAIPSQTDVYAFFDTTSMQQTDGVDAAAALNDWFTGFKAANPNYDGNLYIIPYSNEDWVNFPNLLVTGAITPTTGGQWDSIAALPPNLNTGSWVAPTDLITLAFVDESNGGYHAATVGAGFLNQPTATYTSDFNQFVTNYANFNYFRGVIYPIVQDVAGLGGALVLQAMAALKGTTYTQPEIDATNTTVDVSLLLTENPYSTLGGLDAYNWTGSFDKVSPASDVFNSGTFASELNELILAGAESEEILEPLVAVNLDDGEYFEDASFTLAYSLNTQSWISFYDFTPNYYIGHNNYFQTGKNVALDESELGLWSHLLTNRSYGVYYGKKYEIGLEYPIVNTYQSKTLEDVELWVDGGRYHNELDYAYNRDIIFNKMRVYNRKEASGNLTLVPQKSFSQIRKYPKTVGNTQEILATNSDNRWKVNYIFNRVAYERNNQPIFLWDDNQIKKEFNDKLVRFKGKKVLEPMRGEYFLVYLGYDTDSRFGIEFKWATNKEDLV